MGIHSHMNFYGIDNVPYVWGKVQFLERWYLVYTPPPLKLQKKFCLKYKMALKIFKMYMHKCVTEVKNPEFWGIVWPIQMKHSFHLKTQHV